MLLKSAERLFFLPILYYNEFGDKMDKENNLPKRKSTRLKNFDYSSVGAYFVTICVRDRMNILSEIVKTDLTSTAATSAGRGHAQNKTASVGEGLAPPGINAQLTLRMKCSA